MVCARRCRFLARPDNRIRPLVPLASRPLRRRHFDLFRLAYRARSDARHRVGHRRRWFGRCPQRSAARPRRRRCAADAGVGLCHRQASHRACPCPGPSQGVALCRGEGVARDHRWPRERAHARHLARDRGGPAEPGRDPLSCPRHGRFRHGSKRKDGGCGPPQGHPQTTSRTGRAWSLRFRPHRLVLSPWRRRLRDIRSGACARSAKPTLGTRPLGRHQPLVRSHQCARASGAAGPDRRPRGGAHHRRPRRHERLDSER